MSSLHKELDYDQDINVVNGIQFSLLGAKEIIDMSVVEITKTDTSGEGGLFDPRMGVMENNKICPTCFQKNMFCPGHFGRIELSQPVYHMHFIKQIKQTLECVCWHCQSLLVDPDSSEIQSIISKKGAKRLDLISQKCKKVKKCGQFTTFGCGAKVPIVKIGQTGDIAWKGYYEWKDMDLNEDGEKGAVLKITPEMVLKTFQKITDSHAEILGFPTHLHRPENLICTVLPVPPPALRPSVKNDIGQRSEDDLTHKLAMIVKFNNNLKNMMAKNSDSQSIEKLLDLLQYEIATFIDNTNTKINTATQRTGRPVRSVVQRLTGKEGRIRGNLMGKRVDFSARSVITPDPNISIDELGVPIIVAMNLTFPEIVTQYNIRELKELVLNGPQVYPGAKYVRKTKEKRTMKLQNSILKIVADKIEIGDVVERHMKNGDVVLFNRQPSLHRMSMLAHRVKIMPNNTFRLNVMVTPNYNADFDGDEMNLHLPQSLQTQEELLQLASVPLQIISPRESKPIISIVQDIALGVFRITKPHVRLTEKQFFNLIATNQQCSYDHIPPPSKIEGKEKYWSGRQLLSTIIPKKINVDMKSGQYNETKSDKENENHIISIRNGEILSGTFDKDVYQSRTKGLVHSIFNEYGPEETRIFFDNTQKMICNWLVLDGFSVGISDMVVKQESEITFKETIRDMKSKVYDLIRKNHEDLDTEEVFAKSRSINFEENVNNLLNQLVNKIGKLGLQEVNDENRLINMIKSKSKGQPTNLSQIIGCLGQQNVDGKRIPYGFDYRTLPHFQKYDDGPDSRGFVQSSFIKGLTPQEFYFHAIAGREGLIDTAVQTSETGYIQRKLVKAMEDCKVYYDGSVRNASGSIIQFLYGDDGMDATKIESQQIPYINYNFDEFKARYSFNQKNIEEDLQIVLVKETYKELLKNRDAFEKKMQMHIHDLINDRDFILLKMFKGRIENSVMYPVSLFRIINIAKGTIDKLHNGNKTQSDLSPIYILDRIDELSKELYVNKFHRGTNLFNMLLRVYLSPKIILMQHGLNKIAFDYVINTIKKRFFESLAHPSEMVGVISAQSIGEPSTQLTLNTFHSAGISSASKTVRGVPRLKELLSVTKNIKTPMMKIYFNDIVNNDDKKIHQIMNDIRTVYFKDIVLASKIYFDPANKLDNDKKIIDSYEGYDAPASKDAYSPWVLRIEIDNKTLVRFNTTMIQIHQKLLENFKQHIVCYFTDDNVDSGKHVMLIRLIAQENDDMLTNLKALEYNVLNIVIKGINRINKATPVKDIISNNTKSYNPLSNQIEKTSEMFIVTDGSNLPEVLSYPNIDYKKTITNDIVEIFNTLGIEAVRQALFNEIKEVLDATYVDYRHIAMLVDVQTNKGALLSIDRHGINRCDIGPLAKCSFEETQDKLIKAGIFGEYDKLSGVSGSIILGQIAPAGTGDCEILMNHEMLEKKEVFIDKDYTIDCQNLQENIKILFDYKQEENVLVKETRIKNV